MADQLNDGSGDDLDGYDGEFDCPGYPEHDYEDMGEGTYLCRRCGAEYWDDEEGAS